MSNDRDRILRELAQAKQLLLQKKRGYVPVSLTPKQLQFCQLTCKEALFGGAAGSGKTEALLACALEYVSQPDYHCIIFRRTLREAAKSSAVMNRLHEWLAGSDAVWNEHKKQFLFPSGATIEFAYLAGPRDHEQYQGAEYQCIIFDELTHFELKQYSYLRSRLRRKKESKVPLRVRSATNPGSVGHDWVKARFGIPDKPTDTIHHEGRIFIPAKVYENPYIDPEYINDLKQLDTITQLQLLEGWWIRDDSELVYKFSDSINLLDSLPKLPHDEHYEYCLGVDFGFNDPTAFVVVARHEHDPNLYIVHSQKWPELDPHAAANIIKQWDETYKFELIIGDSSGLGKGYIETARQRFQIPIQAADKRGQDGKRGNISLLNSDMQNGLIRILKHNTELIKELRQLVWVKRGDKQVENPGQDNHLTDALLYIWKAAKAWDWQPKENLPKPGTVEEDIYRHKQYTAKKLQRLKRQQDGEWWEQELYNEENSI